MTGPEHYREAERLLQDVLPGTELPDEIIDRAQVHATLAVAAATALHPGLHRDWWDVAGPPMDGAS
jgi:hypothetical protein